MKDLDLSIIIPTYREEKPIANTLYDIDRFLKQKKLRSEILLIDDGSQDNTISIVENLKNKIPNLTLYKNSENRGKGYVVRQGMLKAKAQYVLFMDADSATQIQELEKFLPFTKSYDIIIGTRRLKSENVMVVQPLKRRLLGWLYITCTKLILGLPYSDFNCGFKLFNKKVVVPIFTKVYRNDWSFDAEIFVLAKILNLRIKEIAVNWKHGENSKVHPIQDGLKTFFALFKIKIDQIRGKYNS